MMIEGDGGPPGFSFSFRFCINQISHRSQSDFAEIVSQADKSVSRVWQNNDERGGDEALLALGFALGFAKIRFCTYPNQILQKS